MNKSVGYYILMAFPIAICGLMVFGAGLIIWTEVFGVPCWAFDGATINDSVTREILERCSK